MKQTLKIFARNIMDHDVAKRSAALTYYLLFSLFPMLIFLSNLLGLMGLDPGAVMEDLRNLLPKDAVEIMAAYLQHVSGNSSHIMLVFSLVFCIYFPMQAVRGLMDDVRRAYDLGSPAKPSHFLMRQLIFTVLFMISIIVTLVLTTFGQAVVDLIISWIPFLKGLEIPEVLLSLWQYLRFVLAGSVMFVMLSALYAAAQDGMPKISRILPGAAAALVGWLAVSIGFSFFVENYASYSAIYGALGAVIVLLSWLHLSALILILGAELNGAIANK